MWFSEIINCYSVHRWCKLLRHEKLSHIVVVIVEAVGAADFAAFRDCFPFLVNKFPMVILYFLVMFLRTVLYDTIREFDEDLKADSMVTKNKKYKGRNWTDL